VHVLVLWAFSCMSELVCLLDVDIVSYRENLNEFRQTISQTQVLITILIVPDVFLNNVTIIITNC
jgi:predicted glycosyltransferase involved in capsule biosynthesis